ncbi:helicase HerA domain-containing protein [Halalkalicoccus sp. GCM10025322]|uniref:ATP-binding protein n=1 Tax=Halalkalicoccus TaxID=332246 RepID=UPI002F968D9B
MSEKQRIAVGEGVGSGANGKETIELPVVEVLTGRGFVTGKSGSGKSNTASVVVEELLEAGYPVLIVDTDGEYYGLKEEYELLHAGADEECDIQIGPEHAEKVATLALEQNVPTILDVSGYLDEAAADELLRETARHLFAKEKKLKKPFLLVVEEVHEYIPEGGGMDETGRMLIKIGKRGRKHGLGIVGISQRPADVKKDFITQANWLVWHRLTWDNDTKVVGRIVGTEYGERVAELDAGEAFLQTDWTEGDVRRVRFKRKRTFDAGATPGLDDFERPELKSVSDTLVDDLQTITESQQREADRVAELERRLERKDDRIDELERELESARDVSAAARQMAAALSEETEVPPSQATLPEATMAEELDRLRSENTALEAEIQELRRRLEERGGEATNANERETEPGPRPENSGDPTVEISNESDDHARQREDPEGGYDDAAAIAAEIEAASRRSLCSEEQTWAVIETLAETGGATAAEVEDRVRAPVQWVWTLLMELRGCSCVERTSDGVYSLSPAARDLVLESADPLTP